MHSFLAVARKVPAKLWMVGGIIAFAAIGTITFTASRAATSFFGLETENGSLGGCATASTDSMASQGKAIRFGSCTGSSDITTPLNLDATGKTIPDSDYAIPSGAIFMAASGDDANTGTQNAPVKTLNKAIAAVPSGGTIVVRGGTYHDGYTNTDYTYKINAKSLTIQAYPREKVWFDGMQPVTTGWTSDGAGHWSVAWNTPQFCNGRYYERKYNNQNPDNTGPCAHYDNYSGPENPTATDPQLVYINDSYVQQVDSLSKVTATSFYYDWENKRTYIGTEPSGKDVQLGVRGHFLVSGGSGVNIKGIGFRRYATAEYEGIQSVALYNSAKNSTIENSVFTQMAAGSVALQPLGGVFRHNVMAFNGYGGFGANGHSLQGIQDSLLMEANVISDNNTEKIGIHCTRSCGQGGVKLGHMNGFTVKNNIFQNTASGAGFWCDEVCNNGVMVGNIVRNNAGPGIFYEVSNNGIIASNLIYNNSQYGIDVASANTKVYNNTLIDNGQIGIWVYDDSRNANDKRGSDPGPDTVNIDVVNNIIFGGSITSVKLSRGSTDAAGLNTGPNTFMRTLDYNAYYRREGSGRSLINWVDSTFAGNYKSLPELQAQHPGFEKNGLNYFAPSPDPYFVNLTGGDYRVRSDSPAYRSAAAPPDDVANALGLTTKTGYSRGAIFWPGSR